MSSKNNATIVYAEDSKSISKLVKSKLLAEGYDVLHFENGLGVVESVIEKKPTVVILDNEMPEKDGMTVLTELKNLPETKDIPIIFFTTKNDQESVLKCLQLGVKDYIVKDALAVSNLIPRIKKYF